jgi:3-hydroxyisobutyrate dehydrogenase
MVLVSVHDHGQAVRALFGDQGAAARLPVDARVVMTSTIGVDAIADIAGRLTAAGARTVDAPVSGGPRRARDGDLLVMAAGEEEDLAAVEPVLAALASTLVTAGPRVGDGQLLKTINQLLAGVHIAAAAEALALAARAGLDPRAVVRALSPGAGGSFMLADRGPRMAQMIGGEVVPVHSRVSIFVKDMGLVEDLAASSDMDAPLAAAAREQFRQAAEAGLADSDDSALVRLFAQETIGGQR